MQSPLVHWIDRIYGYEDMYGVCGDDIAYGVDYSTEVTQTTCRNCLLALQGLGKQAEVRANELG